MAEKTGDCYIDIRREADSRGETTRIRGPAEYPTLALAQGRWGDIGSLRVGPNAFVMAYHRRDFQDRLVTFGPNDEVADLGVYKSEDEIESLKVIDSLRIFDRAGYNRAGALPGAAADAEPAESHAAAESPGPQKRRRPRGKR